MVDINDRFYISGEVIKKACQDSKLNNYTPPIRLLFHSLGLRKKFSLNICLATTETLLEIANGEHREIWKNPVLSESLEEDSYTYKRAATNLEPLYSLILCIPFRAGECRGKIKVVTIKERKELFEKLMKAFKLPAEVMDCESAANQLYELHQRLIERRESNK